MAKKSEGETPKKKASKKSPSGDKKAFMDLLKKAATPKKKGG